LASGGTTRASILNESFLIERLDTDGEDGAIIISTGCCCAESS